MRSCEIVLLCSPTSPSHGIIDLLLSCNIAPVEFEDAVTFSRRPKSDRPEICIVDNALFEQAKPFLEAELDQSPNSIAVVLLVNEELDGGLQHALSPLVTDTVFDTVDRERLFLVLGRAARRLDPALNKLVLELKANHDVIEAQAKRLETIESVLNQLATRVTALLDQHDAETPAPAGLNGVAADRVDAKRTLWPAMRTMFREVEKDHSLRRFAPQIALLTKYLNDIGMPVDAGSMSTLPITELLETHSLSNKELRIAAMIHTGMTTEEIAECLHVSPDTVKTHRRNIRRKLALVGRKDSLNAYLQSLNADNEAADCNSSHQTLG